MASMEILWKNWKIPWTSMEILWKILEIQWTSMENLWKILKKYMEIYGKYIENIEILWKTKHGKFIEIYRILCFPLETQ